MAPTGKNLTDSDRNAVAQFLLESSTNGKKLRGKMLEAAVKWGCHRNTISTIWANAKEQISAGIPINLINKKSVRVQTKRIQFDNERLKGISLRKRGTYRRIAREMEISKTTVGRWVKDGLIRSHTNAIKPLLTQKCMHTRLQFSLQALEVDSTHNVIKFKSMQNIIHIDEKWFNLSRASERFYLGEGEADPYRTCQNKKFITKVMFLCAVARPMYSEDGVCLFDGKIGIFPFTHIVAAQRTSKNRIAGTLETKALDSVTMEVTKQCLIDQVIRAIKAKWPIFASKDIIVQQDNARPHIKDNDPDFREAASSDGFNIHIAFQPPNSPDTNILDLGWFRVIHSLQVETAAYTIDQLLVAVRSSFEELSHTTLNYVFLTLQGCMKEIMEIKGHNNYKTPHMNKLGLLRAGTLPHVLEVDVDLVKTCIDYLFESNEVAGSEEMITAIEELPSMN